MLIISFGDNAWVDSDGEQKGLIAMYHSSLDKTNEAKVVKEFSKVDSSIRGVITIAFGMLYTGISKGILKFWQEEGRCGKEE